MSRKRNREKKKEPERSKPVERALTRASIALVLYVTLCLVATWPVPFHLSTKLPMGTEPSPTVPLFNLWTMGWNATWPFQDGSEYWNAPIFHPATGTFAFSDPQPLTGLLAAPLWHSSPVLAYNFVLLAFLVLNGWAGRSLLLARGLDSISATIGGLFVLLLPFLAHERGVLQLQPLFPAIWAIDQLWKLAERGRLRNGVGLGAAIAATFLMSEYLAIFLVFFLLAAIPLLWREWRRSAWPLALAVTIAAILVLPVAVRQGRSLNAFGFERTQRTVEQFSASASDYLRRSPALWHADASSQSSSKYLSPGFLLLALAGAGAWWGLGRDAARRRWTWFLLLAGAWTFFLSLGPASGALYEVASSLPGLESLRSPFRFGLFVQLAFALLAASAAGASRVTLVVAGLALVEMLPRPSPMVDAPPIVERTDIPSPVVFLPFVEGTNASDYFRTTAAMCALLPSGLRLVNGYSGYFPELNGQLKTLLKDFPTASGMTALRALGVQSLFFELDRMSPVQIQRLNRAVAEGHLEPMGSALGVQLARLSGSRLRPASEYRGRFELEGRSRDTDLELLLSPVELDGEMYVVSPGTAPVKWRIQLYGEEGETHEYLRSPLGSVLLQDDASLRLRVPRPHRVGDYDVRVLALEGAEMVAEGRVSVTRR